MSVSTVQELVHAGAEQLARKFTRRSYWLLHMRYEYDSIVGTYIMDLLSSPC